MVTVLREESPSEELPVQRDFLIKLFKPFQSTSGNTRSGVVDNPIAITGFVPFDGLLADKSDEVLALGRTSSPGEYKAL